MEARDKYETWLSYRKAAYDEIMSQAPEVEDIVLKALGLTRCDWCSYAFGDNREKRYTTTGETICLECNKTQSKNQDGET